MEDFYKHPLVVATTLVFAIVTGIINLKLSTDPNSRPDPFTGTEGARLAERVERLEQWRNIHTEWGVYNQARVEAQIEELYKHIGHK